MGAPLKTSLLWKSQSTTMVAVCPETEVAVMVTWKASVGEALEIVSAPLDSSMSIVIPACSPPSVNATLQVTVSVVVYVPVMSSPATA